MMHLLSELCALPGVSGCEDAVREYILEQILPYIDHYTVDAIGNLIVYKKGKKKPANALLICAHMDEVGLIVKKITQDGFIQFDCVGGIDGKVLIGKRVSVGQKQIDGVIGLKAVHLSTAKERETVPKIDHLVVDIGMTCKEDAEQVVTPGDYIAFSGDCFPFGENRFKAKAIDDRLGCAIMIKLIQCDLPMDCTFAFTVQEEIGTRGAFGAAFSVSPQIALVLETTTAADLPNAKEEKRVCTLGKGPVISLIDNGTLYDKELFSLLTAVADKKKIPWQVKHTIAGGNDARAIQRRKEGIRVAGLSAAVRYLHAPTSVVDTEDITHMYSLAYSFVEALAEMEN